VGRDQPTATCTTDTYPGCIGAGANEGKGAAAQRLPVSLPNNPILIATDAPAVVTHSCCWCSQSVPGRLMGWLFACCVVAGGQCKASRPWAACHIALLPLMGPAPRTSPALL
jgi:hypothetical protein